MMVKLGNWLFHYRNYLFPIFYIALFIPSPPLLPDYNTSMIFGLLFILFGILIRCTTIGLVYIVRGGKHHEIYSEGLVTEGIYTICRNPMYLGNILLLFGFGLFSDSILFIFIFFPLFLLFYYAIIKAEEEYLSNKFGGVFLTYKNNTNALTPDFKKLRGAFRGHAFKWKKVLNKEHTSLQIYGSGILLLLLYKGKMEFLVFLILFIALALLNALVKLLKENNVLDD